MDKGRRVNATCRWFVLTVLMSPLFTWLLLQPSRAGIRRAPLPPPPPPPPPPADAPSATWTPPTGWAETPATPPPRPAGERPLMSFHIALDYSSGGGNIAPAGATAPANPDGVSGTLPNGLRLLLGHIDAYLTMPLASWAYVGVGVDLGIGEAQGGRCTQGARLRKQGLHLPGTSSRAGAALREEYGVSAKMLLSTPPPPPPPPSPRARPHFSLSIPTIRVKEQLRLSYVSSSDPNCASTPRDVSWLLRYKAVDLSAAIEFDWTEWSSGSVSEVAAAQASALRGPLRGSREPCKSDELSLWFFRAGPHLDF